MAKTRRRKKRTHVEQGQDPTKKPDPKTFVFRRGKHGALLGDLEQDIRRMMLPNTAMNLRESKRNIMKDFVSVAGPLGVTHFIILTGTDNSSYMRVAKTPRGPTLTLRIKGYSLMRDVIAAQARPRMPQNAFKTAPLLVMNQFKGHGQHLQLAGTLFQAMFPALHVGSVKLANCNRVVLLNHDPTTGRLSLRHYTISMTPSGVKKSLKALLARKLGQLPDLGAMADASELLTRSGYGSESEGEDAEASRVVMPEGGAEGAAGAGGSRQSRVRLHEIGPRLDLEVVKVEEGLCTGQVLYHAHVQKTAAESAQQQKAHDDREVQRAARRRQQEDNVRRKEAEKKRKASLQAAADKQQQQQQQGGKEGGGGRGGWLRDQKRARADDEKVEEDDDEEYFRQEVGEEPEQEDKMGFRGRHQGGQQRGRGGRGRGRGRGRGGRDSHGDEYGVVGGGEGFEGSGRGATSAAGMANGDGKRRDDSRGSFRGKRKGGSEQGHRGHQQKMKKAKRS